MNLTKLIKQIQEKSLPDRYHLNKVNSKYGTYHWWFGWQIHQPMDTSRETIKGQVESYNFIKL